MNAPLTEQDIIRPPEGALREYLKDIKLVSIEEVQSAKRLLKHKVYGLYIHGDLMRNLINMIDACFQIPDGDDK